ncbi:MAG: DUF541 domain-containing protein [Deltaproteobacteria bacterium]|nr:MAG: DUF541 domain-containing protein [Deltaproteobacteria bacterium]
MNYGGNMRLTRMIVLSLLLILPSAIFAAENIRKITVTGKSEIVVEAHYAIIQLNIRHVKKEMIQSHNELLKTISELTGELKDTGLSDTDIKKSLVLQGQEYSWEDNSQVLKGYFSECFIELNVKDINKLDEVYKALANYRSVSIIGTEFRRNDEFEVRKTEFEKALHAARKKAEYMANALNAKIGKVYSIQEASADDSFAVNTYSRLSEKGAPESKSGYGSIQVTAIAVVEFELE